MKASIFEPTRYFAPHPIPADWPVPGKYYDAEAGAQSYASMMRRVALVEDVGFDWVSFSEHHYSQSLSPSPIVVASHMAAKLKKIKFAVLGPIIPLNNPVRVAEDLAMLDNLSEGRLIVGLLRGTPNEHQTYSVNPAETRDRTTEGMELVLRAWEEVDPFAWEGQYYRFRAVSVWPRPLQQPMPPIYSLGTSHESCEFAARHHIGFGVSFAPFDVMCRVTDHYRELCVEYGWTPGRDDIIYRGTIVLGRTDEEAQNMLAARQREGSPFPIRPNVMEYIRMMENRNIAGETARTPVKFNAALPTTFVGGPDTVVDQVRRCRDVLGAGAIDFLFPGATPESLECAIELFGEKVLPRIRDI